MSGTPTAEDISPRDLTILKVRVANPTASTRELSAILEAEYDVSLSHNRINEILRELAEAEVFRETIIPNEGLFNHYLFRIAFFHPNFAEYWEDCYWSLVDDPHVMMFFNADSDYHWHVLAQFRRHEQMERWVHGFFKEHGKLISGFHNTSLHGVHKFHTDAAIFDDILAETEEGRKYLESHAQAASEADD